MMTAELLMEIPQEVVDRNRVLAHLAADYVWDCDLFDRWVQNSHKQYPYPSEGQAQGRMNKNARIKYAESFAKAQAKFSDVTHEEFNKHIGRASIVSNSI
jgi:hypothetical protein